MFLIVKLRSTGVSTTAFSPIKTLLNKKPHHTIKSLSETEQRITGLFYLELDGMTANKRNKKIIPTGTIFIGGKVSLSQILSSAGAFCILMLPLIRSGRQ